MADAEWLGVLLSNGKRCVRVVSVRPKHLLCEDLASPVDETSFISVPFWHVGDRKGYWQIVGRYNPSEQQSLAADSGEYPPPTVA